QAARRGGAGAATLLAWGRRSAAEVYEAFLSSPLLLGAGAALGPGVWGLGPHAPRSGLAALGFALRHVAPPARPVGGGGAFSAALRASLEEAGGLVRTSTRVTALLVEGERVVGVATESGDELRAKAVVAACDPRSALLRWLADPPPAAASRLAAWRSWTEPDGCESRLDAVVDRLPGYQRLDRRVVDALAVDPLAATVVLAPSVAEIDLAHRASAKGEIARSPVMLAGLPSVLDRTLRPDKRGHVLSLQVLFTPYALKGGWPGSGEPRRWLGEYAERLEPGFLEGVRAWRATTPDRYEAELGLPRGHAASGVGGPLAALSGQAGELSRYETPIEGLFLSAAATFPGAGSWAASGRNAAHVVLERLEGLGRSRRPRRRTASGASAP
ncbi:MAG: phytoene desaturase family protein, partial [Acidimicrobiales bacterium]